MTGMIVGNQPFDEQYPAIGTDNAYVTAAQVSAQPRRLMNLYLHNKSASTIYVLLADSADALVTGKKLKWYVLGADQWVSEVWAGGLRCFNGIYVKGVTAAGGTTVIGSADLQVFAGYTALQP
jgi:hypothetical protein